MKKINLNFVGVDPVVTKVGPGVWHYLGSDETTSRLIVLNQTPAQHMDDWGGYNAIDTDADAYASSTGYSISIKQFTTFADKFQETPPKGCVRNYKTLQECVDALEAGTDIQGEMLNDNV